MSVLELHGLSVHRTDVPVSVNQFKFWMVIFLQILPHGARLYRQTFCEIKRTECLTVIFKILK
jgi:hypothetical protein